MDHPFEVGGSYQNEKGDYEVVAIEERMIDGEVVKGNQSIAENFFCTAPIATLDCELPE